jgi:uncharacterized protein
MSDILETLFGSRTRARMLRFFLLNSDQEYHISEIIRRNMTRKSDVLREINNFKKIKFILERIRKGKKYYILNTNFPFYPELRNLVVKSNIYPQCSSLGKIKYIGDVKLALISGVFLNYSKSKADMILVANSINRRKLKNLINSIEAEIGKEIKYVLINSEELKYRLNMLDRFLLEFFEGPHDEIINKVPGLKRFISNLKR